MIPKKIHYCWFGGKPLPKSAIKCINSWKKFCPDYEIIEWNESNYDVNKILYTSQAYQNKKYAFVSDYARFDILYREGGVYFDTDVEVIKPIDDIIENGAFMGCETDGDEMALITGNTNKQIMINPGLGIAAEKGLKFYKEILDFYKTQEFVLKDGKINTETVVMKTTKILFEHGLKNVCGIQKIEDIMIYPKEYFNPFNNNTGELYITDNTYSIHWYSQSWLSGVKKVRSKLTRPIHRLFGVSCLAWMKRGLKCF